jgi:hypothetical protein
MSRIYDDGYGGGGVGYYYDEVGGESDTILVIDDHATIQVGPAG